MASKLLDQLKSVCPENVLCTKNECNLMHPRCLAGICINYLNENCQKDSCPKNMNHLKLVSLKKELQCNSINGVFMINLCPEQNCSSKNNKCYYCQFINQFLISHNLNQFQSKNLEKLQKKLFELLFISLQAQNQFDRFKFKRLQQSLNFYCSLKQILILRCYEYEIQNQEQNQQTFSFYQYLSSQDFDLISQQIFSQKFNLYILITIRFSFIQKISFKLETNLIFRILNKIQQFVQINKYYFFVKKNIFIIQLYLHKDWIIKENVCVKYILDVCGEDCKLKHINWDELRNKVIKQFEYKDLSPEAITDVDKKYNGFEQFCLKNFKGICDYKGKCPKNHIDWEQIKYVSAEQFQKKKLIPCTRSKKPQMQKMDSKSFQKLELLFEKTKLQELHQNIRERNIVDVLFIMDCTGSMQHWIDSAKESISSIIDNFNKAVSQTQIRVGFVGYRDFSDSKRIEYHDFTTDIELIKQFISTLIADGGDDEAEDVAGGIEQALKLSFSKHPLSILCTFLISDAPTHGKQYQDNLDEIDDNYKDKIQDGSLEKLMRELDNKKVPNNYFFCCKINNTTDKMYQIMKNNFKNLEISELDSKDFENYITFSIRQSYTKSTIINPKRIQTKSQRFQASFVLHKAIEPVECDPKNNINYFTNFLTQMGKNQIGGDTMLEINMNQQQLTLTDQGQVSYIFEAFDIRNNLKIAIKVPKMIVDLSQKGQVDNNLLKAAQRSSFVRYNQTLIAKQLSAAFRDKTRQNNKAPPIYYVTPIKYNLCNSFFGLMELYAETFILIEGPWEKISNNTDFIDKKKENYSAFSHFTYHFTNKSLVITDLQGKQGVLSDPCLHTNKQIEYLQDQLNLGQEGIETFFETQHTQCNEICKKLGLRRNCDSEDLPPDRNYLQVQQPEIKFVNSVCVICGDIFQITYKEYQNNIDASNTCKNCNQVNEFSEICECCGDEFKFDLNRVLKQALDLKVCENCQKECQNHQCQSCVQLLQKQLTFCDQCEMKQACYYCQTICSKRKIKEKVINANGESRNLCEDAFNFFENLYCSKCLSSFSYQKWPSQEDYIKGEYLCYDCRKN